MTREAFEAALDTGALQTKIYMRDHLTGRRIDKWYDCRRNGKTKLWKSDPTRFEIPFKYRFKDCARITSKEFYNGTVDEFFRINGRSE